MRNIRNAIRGTVGLLSATVAVLILVLAILIGSIGILFVIGFHWINEMED